MNDFVFIKIALSLALDRAHQSERLLKQMPNSQQPVTPLSTKCLENF